MSARQSTSRTMRVLTVLFGLSGLASALVLAQSGPWGYGHHEPGGMHQLQDVLGTLSLTSDQQAAIDKIFSAHRDAGQAGSADFMTAKKALADQVHAETLDETAIRLAAANVAALEADRAVAEATMLSQVRAQLSPAQRVQLQQELSNNSEVMQPMGPMAPRHHDR